MTTLEHTAHAAPRSRRPLGLTLCQLAVPALAIPSAMGVAKFFSVADGAGHWTAQGVIAAAGFELMNVGLSILDIRRPELHQVVQRVRFWSVTTAILLNTIAHYGQRVPGLNHVDVVGGLLALVASVPLAVLYVALAGLLHAISAGEHAEADERAGLRQELAQAREELARLRQTAARAEHAVADARQRVAQAEQEAAQARQAGDTRAAAHTGELAQLRHHLAQMEAQAAQRATEMAQLRQQLAQADQEVAQARQALARRPADDGEDWISYHGQRFTLAQLVEATGLSSGTLRRRLAQVNGVTAQAAD